MPDRTGIAFNGQRFPFAAQHELFNTYPNHIIIKLNGKLIRSFQFQFMYPNFFLLNPTEKNATAIVNQKIVATAGFNSTIADNIGYFSFASGTINQMQQYFFNCRKPTTGKTSGSINSDDIE